MIKKGVKSSAPLSLTVCVAVKSAVFEKGNLISDIIKLLIMIPIY